MRRKRKELRKEPRISDVDRQMAGGPRHRDRENRLAYWIFVIGQAIEHGGREGPA